MIRRTIALCWLSPLIAGCVHSGLMPTDEHRRFASEAFEYALLAHNAYAEEEAWVELPPDVSLEVECGNDEIGLAYSIFRRRAPGRDDYLFTFRGTEGFSAEGKKDWKHGNLAYDQQRRSEPIALAFANAHPDAHVVFVGHSLGGALAIHNSMRITGRRVYVFNTSPRFYPPPGYVPSADPSQRLSIVERGEVLKAARIFFNEAWQTYMPFNCFGKGNPVFQHSMLRLAVCLTRIAAAEPATPTAQRARQYIDLNPWMIDATAHPLVRRKPLAPCQLTWP